MQDWLVDQTAAVEAALRELLAGGDGLPEARMWDCMRYSAMAGGKRLRPALLLAAWDLAGGKPGERAGAVRAAAAVEMMHTYSLMQDDMPCMDNDTLRRGVPTAHVAFDEATALLASDGLQALAYETLVSPLTCVDADVRCVLVRLLAEATGPGGMLGGQMIDMEYEWAKAPRTEDELRRLHALKTGALITACVRMGGWLGAGGPALDDALLLYGRRVGLAFQMMDDVLDVTTDSATLGKTAGKDVVAGKTTFVTLMGVEGARSAALGMVQRALEPLEPLGDAAEILRALARMVATRKK